MPRPVANFIADHIAAIQCLKSDKVLFLQLFQHCQRLALKPCAKPLGHFLECADPFARIDGIANTINAAV